MTYSGTQGAQSFDELVWESVKAHIESEKEILADYARIAEHAEAPEISYLISLIVDDEMRHHRLFTELGNTLRGAVEWRHIEPSVPGLGHQPLSEMLLERTRRLIEVEKDDARQLQRLRRELRPVAKTALWSLLIELMELDTKKHLRILQFIADRRDQ